MRYALYVSPPADAPLTRSAASWLGRDAFSGETVAQAGAPGIDDAALHAFTADPRRYGFHATIKAPFRLAQGRTEAELLEAVHQFAARQKPFTLPALALAAIGPFFALIEDEPVAELARFAGEVVRDFEPFRAPLSEADIARRRPERLSPREREHLETWGYPYVFDEFQFHMSLTGAVPVEQSEDMHRALKRHFRGFIGKPLDIAHIALFEEPEAGADFRVKALVPLAG